MKLLLVDPHGEGLDFAMRAQRDGHDVRHFIRPTPHTKFIAKGLTQVVDDYRPWVRWADLVFMTDNVLYVHDFDQRWRKEGVKVIGPTEETAKWEIDRAVGMEVFRKAHVAVPPFKMFTDYDDAIAYVKRENRRFVSKPCGDDDKALSYCSKSPEDMIYMLQRWKKLGKLKSSFIIQEFIPGIEMAVGGWFGPGGFNAGWCENFEFKKLMNDDLGVATGEQGTVLRYVTSSRLARRVLKPITEQLERAGYVGYIDVNCIIDEKGNPWPLEFTMRPGWPTFNIQQALHEGDHVQWLVDLWNGKDAHNWVKNAVATGVVVSIPDYPYSRLTGKEVVGIPVYGLQPENWENTHPCQMMMGVAPKEIKGKFVDVPMMVTAGDYVLVMSGTGHDVQTSSRSAYRRLKTLVVPNSPMYRTDIGQRLRKQLPELQRMGYATGLEFSTPVVS
jgi:phosphoribosylamine--glycine ligase